MSESFSQTFARLRDAQKGRARGAPAYSVYVNRKIGRLLAAIAYRAGLSPNQVTGVSALFTFGGMALLPTVEPSPAVSVLVWLLLALGYAWDSADGQVARLRGGGSLDGEWLDHFVDSGKVIAIHLAVLVGLYRFSDLADIWLLVPLAFAVVYGVSFFGMILNDLLKSAHGVPKAAARGGGSALRSMLLLPMDYGVLCAIFLLWGWSHYFFAAYGLMFVGSTAFLCMATVKWFRGMKSLTPSPPASAETRSTGRVQRGDNLSPD